MSTAATTTRDDLVTAAYGIAEARAKHHSLKFRLDYDECLSAAHLALMRAAAKYDESRGYFRPFARGVVNQALSDLRLKTKRKNAHFEGRDMRAIETQDTTPTGVLDLRDAMRTLPELERQVIQDFFYGRDNTTDIAERYGLTRDVANETIQRGVTLLREALS